MAIRSLLYRIIYSPAVNFLLRKPNKCLRKVFPSVKIPPSGVIKLKLANQSTLRFKTNQTDYVGFCLFWNGLYSYEYVSLFEKIISKCRGFADIGSNGGLYSLIAAKSSENINVIAFDPTPAAYHFLSKNIQLNNLSARITPFRFAMSDQSATIDFFEVKNKKYPYLEFNLGGASSMVNRPPDYKRIAVQSYSLDEFLVQFHLENLPVDFIKIDAEGAEPLIIKGMTGTIKKYLPVIVCEILPGEPGKNLETLFSSMNYGFYMHHGNGLLPVEKLADEETSGVRNCFFVHPSRYHLIEEFVNR